jgi:hypothetical protein
MKRLFAVLLLVTLMPVAAQAVQGDNVMYAGGTAAGLKEGSVGKLDWKAPDSMTFECSGTKLVIPYATIETFEYTRPVARHLGVLPAIAVGLVKKRQRRHYFSFSYRDDAGDLRVALFEVSKQMPSVLLSILAAKAPGRCRSAMNSACTAAR